MSKGAVFAKPTGNDFYSTYRKRLDQYFSENKLSRYANAFMCAKAIAVMVMFAIFYVSIISAQISFGFYLASWICLALCILYLGFNVMHDLVHGSFFKSKQLNSFFSFLVGDVLCGLPSAYWDMKHNKSHHHYTNINGKDLDLEVAFFVRFEPSVKRHAINRLQIYYIWLLYTTYLLKNQFTYYISPFDKTRARPVRDAFMVVAGKLFYFSLYLVVPIMFGQMPWWAVLVGYAVSHMLIGFIAAIVFQIAHVNENVSMFGEVAEVSSHTFGEHSLKTTANFATTNKLLSNLIGGLNFQVEHHLFPKISHRHYPALNQITKQLAKEFGLVYHEYNSFWQGICSHARHMRKMGA